MTPITMKKALALSAAIVTACCAPAASGKENVGYVNVSGTVPDPGGGNRITIELKNRNNAVVGSTSYTTEDGDTEEMVAAELTKNFKSVGFTANHIKDKKDGTEVIEFKRNRNGGQRFNITVTNREVAITVKDKDSADVNVSCDIVPDTLDHGGGGIATVELLGEGTAWTTDGVTGLDMGDGINVVSFEVVSSTLITATIEWDASAPTGPEHVDVLGNDSADDGTPLFNVVLNVTDQPLILRGAPIPTLPEWGLIAMSLLLASGGTVLIARRTSPALPAV